MNWNKVVLRHMSDWPYWVFILSLNLSQEQVAGEIPQPQHPDEYNLGDIFLLPSYIAARCEEENHELHDMITVSDSDSVWVAQVKVTSKCIVSGQRPLKGLNTLQPLVDLFFTSLDFSHTAITVRILLSIVPTTVYNQVLIYTAEMMQCGMKKIAQLSKWQKVILIPGSLDWLPDYCIPCKVAWYVCFQGTIT